MNRVLTASEIEARARRAGMSVREFCERAEIALSTFYRWKAGKHSPSVATYERLCQVIEKPAKRGCKNGARSNIAS